MATRSYRFAFSQSLAGRFSRDRLDGFAMDRNLPAPDAFVLTVVLLPDGQAPRFQQMD